MLALMLALPLFGFFINGTLALISSKSSHGHADAGGHSNHGSSAHSASLIPGLIASGAMLGAFLIALALFFELSNLDEQYRFLEQTIFSWIRVGEFHIPFTLRIDPLSSLMTLVVTGVGFLIHVYSIGYMSHDATPPKFFAYLNLFSFAMLALVLGGNLPILFLGWEGVGLCSYLLIGYWFEDDAKASAGKKAFIVNRIGDLGFLIGIFIIFELFQTLDFVALKQSVSYGFGLELTWLTIATCCLFVGAMGKSAQIPLYVWLPDAMAGPTPVSALIHAATMVTAGVYMIARLNFLFALCPETLVLVSGVGAFTALFAATIAITQTDIKKVLAYSTVSQLGYMFVAVGVGAFGAGVFHLITHAFFKALLFLGSGSVIHGMHEEQNIMKMGGLRKYMPKTYATFLIGTVAISGIPPFAGFFSKDEILWKAYSNNMGLAGPALWAVGALTALLTAFYMTRLLCLTFFGQERFNPKEVHVHESPSVMVTPLVILAVLSVVGGFIGVPGYSWLDHWLAPVVGEHIAHHDSMELVLMLLSVFIAVLGMGSAYAMYVKNPSIPKQIYESAGLIHKVLFNKYYIDELYDAILVQPIKTLSYGIWKYFDMLVVDGAVVGLAKISRFAGEVARMMQTGAVQMYAAWIILALVVTLGYFIYGIR